MANDVFPGATLRQVEEWGYPKGSPRPTPPKDKAFSVIHITGNSRLPSAENEVAWRINDPDLQNSATFFVNRDGTIVQALGDPLHMDPWANGDVNVPDRSNPRIDAVVRDGVNANERTIVAIENVGYEPGNSITAAQENSCARIIAHYHAEAGVPISRETIVGHYQLNSVSRPNCPAVDKSLLDRIVAKAQGEDPEVIAELKADLERCRTRVKELEARRDALKAQIEELEKEIADLTAAGDPIEQQKKINRLRARIAAIKEIAAQIQEV